MTRSRSRLLAGAACLTLALTACGDASVADPDSTAETPGESTASAEPAPEGEAVTLTATTSLNYETIDPGLGISIGTLVATNNLYDSLLYPDVSQGSMYPVGNVAEEWSVSDDGLVYTFQIRDDIKFHDGSDLTVSDVAYSMQRTLDLAQGYSHLWSGVMGPDDITVIDDYTVAFEISQPYAPMLATLERLAIVNEDLLRANQAEGDFGENGDYGVEYLQSHAAGSGPYELVSFTPGGELILTRFDDYWKGWEAGQITDVNYLFVPEPATQLSMIRSGQSDMTDTYLTVQQYEGLEDEPAISVQTDPSAELFWVAFNTQKPPFDDINFRKAVSYAFDYETAAEAIFGGSTVAAGPVPVGVAGHNDELAPSAQDMDLAREALAASRYAGQEITVEYSFIPEEEQRRQVGLLLQENLAELGISVEFMPGPFSQVIENATSVETTPHMTALRDALKYPHVDSHTFGMFHPSVHGSFRSMAWVDDPELTAVLDEARLATQADDMEALYDEAQQLIVDQYPGLFIVNAAHSIAMQDYLKGYTFVGLSGFDLDFWTLRIER